MPKEANLATILLAMYKKLLIVIDVQEAFLNKFTKDIPVKIKKYLSQNQCRYDFVIFTKFLNKPDSIFVRALDYKRCIKKEDVEISKELQGFVTKNNIFEKTTYSAFKNNDLMDFIRNNAIKEIYLCGLNTDACVLASAFEAFDLGFKVHILKELTGTCWGDKKFNELIIKLLAYKIDPDLLEK